MAQWTTHLAYNNVTLIALTPDRVYAVSNGSLYSVLKQSEKIQTYSNLHGTGITCISYIQQDNLLFIGYGTGKIDLLYTDRVQYVSDLYNKDMTQRKDIYNVTVHGRTAYLSTHYGVQTFDLREKKMVDTYWLRPNGQETPIQDILIQNDSIYAFSADSLYCASMQDNIVDYTYWKREKRGNRIQPDPNKGTSYSDGNSQWLAGGAEGIIRITATERLTYKPQGPMLNNPYRLTATSGKVWVVPGGRWAVQNMTPGVIMRYDGSRWINIPNEDIRRQAGQAATDFMNVAVDPHNKSHYYVTSYGTGLFEFDHDILVRHDVAGGNNILGAAAANDPKHYTRLDFATYDKAGNLWLVDAGAGSVVYQIVAIDPNGNWHGLKLTENNTDVPIHTPVGFVIDHLRPNYKWVASGRENTCLCLLDDRGTRFDTSDDRMMRRSQWTNQAGLIFNPSLLYAVMQDSIGRIWIGSSEGAAYIEPTTDYFTSDAIVQPDLWDESGENPLTSLTINAFCQTPNGEIWVGTQNLGVYVLNPAATEIVAHYTSDNSAMPANGILSLACDENGIVWIGTSEGLASYDPNGPHDGVDKMTDNEENWDLGLIQNWTLHPSYTNPTQLAASSKYIYALANGSLFAFNRADEQLEYWSRATGLNGHIIAHIAYDEATANLIIAYDDGRIDLMDEEGNVRQMPDLYMKAGAIPTTINHVYVGDEYVYLAMPFGIIAVNAQKAEVTDTYYIGNEAASVNVTDILQKGDSLFAFAEDRIYRASVKDNLADYNFWHNLSFTTRELQTAALFQNTIYTLQHDSLYRMAGNTWQLVSLPQPVDWMHEANGQLLVYLHETGLYRLADDGSLLGLSANYKVNDAICSQGEYWLGEKNKGLVRLSTAGDESFIADGPNSNSGYCMTAAHGQMYTANGGRWATEFIRYAQINLYDGNRWLSYDDDYFMTSYYIRALDPVSIAVDPKDPSHFFVATYGTGVLEFYNYEIIRKHGADNSTLKPVNSNVDARFFTRTDGAMIDEYGNLWVLNATEIGMPVHVMKPNCQWTALNLRSGTTNLSLTTPTGIWADRRDGRYKWFMDQRLTQGVILLDDGGTPTENYDDRCIKRSSFVDQNGNTLTPSFFYAFAQDHSNRIWLGTPNGLIIIPETVDFFTSNACQRIIIPRNDGTGLGDYLLGDEQVNCLAVDGGNRMWIGTQNSGVYVIEDDTVVVAHFTETNSLLPSNAIQSIAFDPVRGDIFVGTNRGIASYRSDASEAKENLDEAYAYPNPVRPGYAGAISIIGLMENTAVNIVDAGGNLVCKTRSHGGTAVWDGRLPDGRRATPGIYTALCNAEGAHKAVKIMIIR